jgi:hypothetical protein
MEKPKNSDELISFLALVNYYRKFIPRTSELSYALNEMTAKKAKFQWSEKCEESFEALKDALSF